MANFSMLFGVGVILATQRRDQAGQRIWSYHYERTFWLLIFGMIHAYFICYGDILVTYALCGFVVYWFRNLSVPALFFIGGISLLIALLGILVMNIQSFAMISAAYIFPNLHMDITHLAL